MTEGVDVKLSRHLEQKQQEMVDCQESIVHERQAAEKLEEDIRRARCEKDLALANKQKQVDELRTTARTRSNSLIHDSVSKMRQIYTRAHILGRFRL